MVAQILLLERTLSNGFTTSASLKFPTIHRNPVVNKFNNTIIK